MINIQQTADNFDKYPSESKAQQVESMVEGVSIDHGYSASSGATHEILKEDLNPENPY